MENEWTKRIEELTESRDHWKREWRLLNAGLNMAEDRIKELEAENRRLREQYNSLIFEVSYKFPGESRHDTAKRYIREREEYGIEIGTKQALKEDSHEGTI